jgi:hypothetical protein
MSDSGLGERSTKPGYYLRCRHLLLLQPALNQYRSKIESENDDDDEFEFEDGDTQPMEENLEPRLLGAIRWERRGCAEQSSWSALKR